MADDYNCGIAVPHILIPDEKINMRKWSVVACDQFVYDQEYWAAVDKLVGNAPSTLRMILPETYLGAQDVSERIEDTKDAMYDYIEAGIVKELPEGFMLVERSVAGRQRIGLMVLLDLEQYEFDTGMNPLIRPTEQTIKDRIPPRMQIRIGAPLELPHIIALIDDPGLTVIEPVYDIRSKFKKMYDFDLMQNGGHIAGYFVDDPACVDGVLSSFAALRAVNGMKVAIGDGNHSLATAKEVWNRAKASLSEEELMTSPLRYAMCELINLHDPALDIIPIHRAIVGANPSACIQYVVDKLNQRKLGARLIFSRRKRFTGWTDEGCDHNRTLYFSSKDSNGRIELTNISHVMALEDLQPVLEQLVSEMPAAKLEYIHGDARLAELTENYDTLCFTLPAIAKEDFMQTVVSCGVLPKKCFSLGEENEKRYYLESRLLIIPDDQGAEDSPEEIEAEESAEKESPEKEDELTIERTYERPAHAHLKDGMMSEFASEELPGETQEVELDETAIEDIIMKPSPRASTKSACRDDLDELVDSANKKVPADDETDNIIE